MILNNNPQVYKLDQLAVTDITDAITAVSRPYQITWDNNSVFTVFSIINSCQTILVQKIFKELKTGTILI